MSSTRRSNDAELTGMFLLTLAATVLFWVGVIFVIKLIVKYGYPPIKRFYTHPDPGVRGKRRRATALFLTALCAPVSIASLVLGSYDVSVSATSCAAAAALWWYGEQRGLREQANACLAARADQQHSWVMQSDDRGIYGPQGAQLMHFIQAPPQAAATSEPQYARRRIGPHAPRFAS